MIPFFRFITLAVVTALAASASPAHASKPLVSQAKDRLAATTRVFAVGEAPAADQDSMKAVLDRFYYDQYRHFQDPDAPYFMLLSRGANLAMGIGGKVQMNGWYDWGGAIMSKDLSPFNVPMSRDPLHRQNLDGSITSSALTFTILGHNERVGFYQLYIETGFSGDGRALKLKKAFATIGSWTAGYALSTFSDADAYPNVVDDAGTNLSMDQKALLVRFLHRLGRTPLTAAASVELPQMQIDADDVHASARSQYLPNLAASLRWGLGRDQHVQLAGLLRWLPYRDLVTERDYTGTGWGLQLSSTLHPVSDAVTMYLVGSYGQGYTSYSGDMMAGNYDMVPDPDRPGRLYTPRSAGWVGGLQYNFTPGLFVSASYSMLRYLPQKLVAPQEYKYGQFMCANVFWNPLPRLQVAAEVALANRADFDHRSRWARRAQLMAKVSF